MKSPLRQGAVLLLIVMAAACSRRSPAQQLAALDEAYKSGVFTKDEYDAKRAAILGSTQNSPTQNSPAQNSPAQQAPAIATTPQPPAPAASAPRSAPAAAASRASAPPIASANPAPAHPAPSKATPAPPARQPTPLPAPPPDVSTETATASSPQPQHAAKVTPAEQAPSSTVCEEAESASHHENGPQERFFPLPVERVKQAAEDALHTLDFTVHKDDGNEIQASKNRHIGALVGAGGERETLQFEPASEQGRSGTRVTGDTKKSFMGRLAQKSWTAAVLAQTACNLRSR